MEFKGLSAIFLFIILWASTTAALVLSEKIQSYIVTIYNKIKFLLHDMFVFGLDYPNISEEEQNMPTKAITDDCKPGDIIIIKNVKLICLHGQGTIADCKKCVFAYSPENCERFKCSTDDNPLYVRKRTWLNPLEGTRNAKK